MITLKEKWLNALPVIWGLISIVLLIYLILNGIAWLFTPDARPVKQILEDRYKDCVKYYDTRRFQDCDKFLEQIKITETL